MNLSEITGYYEPKSAPINETPQMHYKNLKRRLIDVVHGKQEFCSFCYEPSDSMVDVQQPIALEHWESTRYTTLVNILDNLLPDIGSNILLTDKVCQICSNNIQKIFEYLYDLRRRSEIIDNYITQIKNNIANHEEVAKLSPQTGNTLLILEDPTNKTKEKLDANTSVDYDASNSQQIICNYCNKTFPTAIGAKIHLTIHSKNIFRKSVRCYHCHECDKYPCVHKKYIEAFKMQKVQGEVDIICPDCQYRCLSKVEMIEHANFEHLSTPYRCQHCGKASGSKLTHAKHIAIFHTKGVECEFCSKKFISRSRLEKHRQICVTTEKPFQCPNCPVACKTERKLLYHKRSHVTKFECNICTKIYYKEHAFRAHMSCHKDDASTLAAEERKFECGICKKAFPSILARTEHLTTHASDEKFKCEFCNVEFATQTHYAIHKSSRRHARKIKSTKNYKCDFCDYAAEIPKTLEAHVNRYHLKQCPYECDVCHRKFRNTNQLIDHKQMHREKTKVCDLCDKKFRNSKTLMLHKRLHDGYKPFKCDVCAKSYVCLNSLKIHNVREHGKTKIKCFKCPRKYNIIGDFRNHFKRTHWDLDGPFDITKVKGLTKEQYDMFRDRRLAFSNIEENIPNES